MSSLSAVFADVSRAAKTFYAKEDANLDNVTNLTREKVLKICRKSTFEIFYLGKFSKASKRLSRAIAKVEDESSMYGNLLGLQGCCYKEMLDIVKAMSFHFRELEIYEESEGISLHCEIASDYLALGDLKNGRLHLEKAKRALKPLSEDFPIYELMLMDVLFAEKNFKLLLKVIQQGTETNPSFKYIMKGKLLIARGSYAEARSFISGKMNGIRDYSRLFFECEDMGSVFFRMYSKYGTCVAQASLIMAQALEGEHRFNESLTHYDNYVRDLTILKTRNNPHVTRAMRQLACFLIRRRRYDEAKAKLEEAVKINSSINGAIHIETAKSCYLLGWCLQKMDDVSTAAKLLNHSSPILNQKSTNAYLHLIHSDYAVSKSYDYNFAL